MKRGFLACLLPALLLAAGCAAGDYRRLAPGFDPRLPRRVAVLPFLDHSTGDTLVSQPLTALVDLVPVLADDRLTRENAATVCRQLVYGQLHRTALDAVALYLVDSALAHRGLDPRPAYAGDRAAAARQLGEAAATDLVLFGEVLAWDREYYLLESVVRVGLRLELRDTATGAVVYEAGVADSRHSGLSRLPLSTDLLGLAGNVLTAPLQGLSNSRFAEIADRVAGELLAGLAGDPAERAAAPAPRLYFVAHSAAGSLAPGDELVVIAIGDEDCRATFQVGAETPPVPMTEGAPGSYRGALVIGPAHHFAGETLTVRLVSRRLRSTTMTAARPPLRIIGFD